MSVELNHTIVWCRDKQRSAEFMTAILGRQAAEPWGPFLIVDLDNQISLDFHETDEPIASQHYAFLIGDAEFDAAYARIVAQGLDHWADPSCATPGINDNDGGRGTYFRDPDGHLLEIITRPYGAE